MRNLLLFLWKYNFFFLFLLLEFAAGYLIVQENYYHKNVFIHSSNQITGSLFEITHDIKGYFTLNRQNAELARENARLRNHSKYALMESSMNTIKQNDTIYYRYLEYIPARVVSSTVGRRNNTWIINKGKNQGITNDMGVISPQGVVGVVVEVSKNFGLVYSVLHKQTHLSAKLKKNNHKGFITWPGVDYRRGYLEDIPSHVNVSRGDTVVSSGNSLLFPEEIPIGTVEEVELESGESFYDITVRFSEDYNNTEYVYVVKNLMKEEQEKLLEKNQKRFEQSN